MGRKHAKELDEFLDRAIAMCDKRAYRELYSVLQQQVRLVRDEFRKELEDRETFKRTMMELAKYGQTEPGVVLRTTSAPKVRKEKPLKKRRKTGKQQ